MIRFFIFIVIQIFIIDLGCFYVLKRALTRKFKKGLKFLYWGLSIFLFFNIFIHYFISRDFFNSVYLAVINGIFYSLFIAKLITSITGLIAFIINFFRKKVTKKPSVDTSRRKFLYQASALAGGLSLAISGFGILYSRYDFRLRKVEIPIKNLPKAFHGLEIVQFSDVHSGSFFDHKTVQYGAEMIMDAKPDIIFFTGDLINDKAEEVNDYFSILNKINAPLGVYSILGNHDYGEYYPWKNQNQKNLNFKKLIEVHKKLGWDLLRNENRQLKIDSDVLALIGVENWGTGRFPKFGDVKKSISGIEDIETKILLSHDPSHWDAQVNGIEKNIQLMLSGHTHGMQLGIELGDFKWSPSQYRYKQWAGLYTNKNQHLYVNRGFGFLGFPGRIGILPEITKITLLRA